MLANETRVQNFTCDICGKQNITPMRYVQSQHNDTQIEFRVAAIIIGVHGYGDICEKCITESMKNYLKKKTIKKVQLLPSKNITSFEDIKIK